MSDSTESWSSSGSSYSGRFGPYLHQPIGSRPANRAQRFMQNLCDRFKLMTRAKSSAPATRGWYYLVSSGSDSDVPLRPLSGLLRADIQRSVGETGSDEIVQIINMVIQIPPGADNETVMYEMKDPTSSGNNAEGAVNIQFKDGSLAAILLSQEPAFINLNFPKLAVLMESFSKRTCTEDEDEESSLDGEADGQVSQDFFGNSDSVTKIRAEMSVFKSGRATLSIGSKVFVLTMAANPKIAQKVVHLDLENHHTPLGLIQYYIDVLEQEEV